MITLYSTGCPKCNVLKKKLEQLNKDYRLIEDLDEVSKFAEDHDLRSAPILVIDDNIYDFIQANKVLKEI